MDTMPIPAELLDAPPFATELDEALMLGSDVPETAQRFKIENIGQAEWAMRKLAAIAARQRQVSTQALEWMAQISHWEETELRRCAPSSAYFSGLLERWAIEERERTGEKTQHLPSGEVPTRKASAPKAVVVDEQRVVDWLYANAASDVYENVVQTKRSVRLTELRATTTIGSVLADHCSVCGFGLAIVDVKDGAGNYVQITRVSHDDPAHDDDHRAVAEIEQAVTLYGKRVPGAVVEHGEVSATVKPAL